MRIMTLTLADDVYNKLVTISEESHISIGDVLKKSIILYSELFDKSEPNTKIDCEINGSVITTISGIR